MFAIMMSCKSNFLEIFEFVHGLNGFNEFCFKSMYFKDQFGELSKIFNKNMYFVYAIKLLDISLC